MPINMYLNRVNGMSANVCGTAGKTVTFEREISVMNGNVSFVFNYPDSLMTIERIELLK